MPINCLQRNTVVLVNEHNFKEEVLQSTCPVAVKFGAHWCQPCKKLSPIFEKMSKEMGQKMKFVEIDATSSENLAKKYSITALPTILFFENGKQIDMHRGFISEEHLKKAINYKVLR